MALLAPDPRRIADPPEAPAADDRVPDALAAGTPEPLRRDLCGLVGSDRVLHRVSDLVAYASDASPYRLIPQAVVVAHDAEDVRRVLEYGRRTGTPVTLRSGGTSLNGQGQGEGILVDVRRHFVAIAVEEDGATVRVGPGTVLGHVNRALAPHGRKLGPDPASTEGATVGGVVANNSGGMRCGVAQDSYQTLRALTFVLPSGATIDTAAPDAEERFAAAEPELAAGLTAIREEILADAGAGRPHPAQVPYQEHDRLPPRGLPGRLDAARDLPPPARRLRGDAGLRGRGGLRDRAAAAAHRHRDAPVRQHRRGHRRRAGAGRGGRDRGRAHGRGHAQGGPGHRRDPAGLEGRAHRGGSDPVSNSAPTRTATSTPTSPPPRRSCASTRCSSAPDFRRDHETTELYWRVREGMQGLIAEFRPLGTSLILEDVCVPPERVAEAAQDLQALLGKHGFLVGVAGHASAGNLHFVLTPSLGDPADRDRYDTFMHELADLIVGKYDGSLKAEHGTGRNMAPWVEQEWGAKATELMWRIKGLADPDGILGPGVVLNRNPKVHLEHLKSQPAIEEVADQVHRVRHVRAGVPEPLADGHAAPAHRAAARDGAPGARLAGARGARARVRVRRRADMRRRRLLRAGLPGGDRYRRAGQGLPRGAARRRRRPGRARHRSPLRRGRAPRARRPQGAAGARARGSARPRAA